MTHQIPGRGRTLTGLRAAVIGLAAVAFLGGCDRGIEAGGIGTVPNAATPRPSAGTVAQGTVRALRDALAIGRYDLEPATRTYQPAQPASLITVPRSVYQVRLSDPDDGVVLIYELADPEAARAAAQDLAGYLASGPGMINYPGDASFHVAHLGSAVILTWFSPSRSGDPEAAQGAFDLISTVGSPATFTR